MTVERNAPAGPGGQSGPGCRVEPGPAANGHPLSVDALAARLVGRIRDRDLPAGAVLVPEFLASLLEAGPAQVTEALEQLERAGAVTHVGGDWRVSEDRPVRPRELLARAQPLLVAMVRMAAENATPADTAAIGALRNRFIGLAGDGAAETRAANYRAMLLRIAEASGSRFMLGSLNQLLREAEDFILPIIERDMALYPVADPDKELARLARALVQRDPHSAAAAMEDHLLMIGCHMSAVERPD